MGLARFPSRGGFSVRSIFKYVLAALTTVLLALLLTSPATHANSSGATWNGAALQYDGRQYQDMGAAEADESHALPAGSRYYVSIETTSAQGANPVQKAHVIYFAPGADPPSEENATYINYDYDADDGTYSNPSSTQAISVDTESANATTTSCAVEGVGWFVCPVSIWLAQGMDFIFYQLAGFMEVQPIQVNNTEGGLYIAWNIMRAVANIAFIIVFIIIIYSQLTSVAVSNYGIKRLLPRMVIAAIGVNLSFIICAAAIDASNILGYSLQSIFMGMRDELLANGTATGGSAVTSWESWTGFILSGGTAAIAGVVGVGSALIASGGTVLGSIFLLLPALIGLLLAVLVVLLILAARQALIIILVIVAPLAIVAYLLPNTEKWFDKWRGLFLTLLVFFPAFAVVFGGAQLAGAVIIQNATSINMQILGMIVQVAPLVITPLLLKFSGTLIGAIARLVNDPNRGLIDRTRSWSNSHAERHRKRGISGDKMNGNPGTTRWYSNPLRQSSRYLDQRKRRREDRTATSEMNAQSNYENSGFYGKYDRKTGELKGGLALQKATAEAKRDRTHSHHAADIDRARRTQGSLIHDTAMSAQAYKEKAETSQNETSRYYNAIRSNERLASRVGANALYNSSYNLEASKGRLEASENVKSAHYQTERTVTGSALNRSAVQNEISKLKVESAQNSYTAMVETTKATPGARLSVVAERAQSSKDHLETAQQQLQAFFDTQRSTTGTELNTSTLNLERSKKNADTAKANLTGYILGEQSTPGGSLVTVTAEAERAKLKQQKSEEQLTKFVSELKSGNIDVNTLTSQQRTIMQEMNYDALELSAIKRGNESAQYELQSQFADIMTGADPANAALTERMRTIAQGVGGDTARVRAISNAVATARGLDNDALKANVQLLTDEARRDGTNIKYYSKSIIEKVLDGETVMPNGTILTPERIKAALQAQAEEKNIPIFERVIGSTNFEEAMVKEIISLNSLPFKGAGAFAMQDKLKTIRDFASPEEFKHQLSLDHISNLANANATGIAGWKAGEVVEVAKNIKDDIQASLVEIQRGRRPDATEEDVANAESAKNNLKAAYKTVRDALTNEDIVATMNDRESYVRIIEKELATIHGQQPTPDQDFDLAVDASSYTPSAEAMDAAQNLPDNTEDTDDNANTPPPSST